MKIKELVQKTLYMKIQETFCCDWSEDDKFYVITCNGIDIFHFKPNPKSRVEEPIFNRSFIFPVPSYPSDQSGFDPKMFCKMSRNDMREMLCNPLVFPLRKYVSKSPLFFTKAEWSPADLIPDGNSILALLTNVGSVTLWIYQLNDWKVVVDTSQMVQLHLNVIKWSERDAISKYSNALKSNCYRLATSSIAWSKVHIIDGKKYLFFVNVQKSGDLFIWKISVNDTCDISLSVDLELELSTNIQNVISTHWIQSSDSDISVVLGTEVGSVHCMNLKLRSQLEMISTICPWPDEDRIKVSHITSTKWFNDERIILVIKCSNLIVMRLKKNREIDGISFLSFDGLKLTGIKQVSEREFVICGLTGCFFKVTLESDNNGYPVISSSNVETDTNFSRFALYGIAASKNNVIWISCLNPCKTMKKQFGRNFSTVNISYMQDIDPFDCIKNKGGLLSEQWDLLELSRINIVKNQHKNCNMEKYEPLLELTPKMNQFELKLCLWLNFMVNNECVATRKSTNIIKEILKRHSAQYVKELFSKFTENILTSSETEALSLHVRFLKFEFSQIKNESVNNLLNTIEDKMSNVLKDVVEYCEWCDEKLQGPICSNRHSRQYCCVTYRNISECQTLLCPICNNSGHFDLLEQNPLCIFCDSKLKYNALTSDKIERFDNVRYAETLSDEDNSQMYDKTNPDCFNSSADSSVFNESNETIII